MTSTGSPEIHPRLEDLLKAWDVVADRVVETDSAILAFGARGRQAVVLKVARNHGDEWRSGEVLRALQGPGVVRLLDHAAGAVLLERLTPGDSLATMSINGDDDRAARLLAQVIGRMSPVAPPRGVPSVEDWGRAFADYDATGDRRIPPALLEAARHTYGELCRSQSARRLLHGDLHHYNVLLDSHRGWLAIDPKGVLGELEYEAGAMLRNPYERPDLFAAPVTIQRRVDRLASDLRIDGGRILAWAFAQAVLAAVWAIQDGIAAGILDGWIVLAENIRPMLKGVVDAT